MATIAEAVAVAIRHQQEGRLADAESIYRQILAADPAHAQAMHLLGTVALQGGQCGHAIELISSAIKIDHTQSAYFTNLGEAYRLNGQIEQAISCNQNALKIQPKSLPAYMNLGYMYLNRAEFRNAIECFRQAARIAPDSVPPRIGLGQALKETGEFPEAEQSLRRAVRTRRRICKFTSRWRWYYKRRANSMTHAKYWRMHAAWLRLTRRSAATWAMCTRSYFGPRMPKPPIARPWPPIRT